MQRQDYLRHAFVQLENDRRHFEGRPLDDKATHTLKKDINSSGGRFLDRLPEHIGSHGHDAGDVRGRNFVELFSALHYFRN